MAKIDLLADEAIILRDSQITHDRRNGSDSIAGELLLTNFALLVVHKGIWGGIKEVVRLPLEQIKIVNGVPQVNIGMSQRGKRQLHVHFAYGIEAFSLGEADDDSENLIDALLTSAKEKERRNLNEWCNAITHAVLGIPIDEGSAFDSHAGPLSAVMGAVNAVTERVSNSAVLSSGNGRKSVPANKTCRCIGCMAPLSGKEGQRITCKYCDTEQVI